MSSRVAASGPPDHGRPDMALAGRPPDIGGAAPPDILRGACMHECACSAGKKKRRGKPRSQGKRQHAARWELDSATYK